MHPSRLRVAFPVRFDGMSALDTSAQGAVEVRLPAHSEPVIYSYQNEEDCEKLMEYQLVNAIEGPVVRDAEAIFLVSWHALSCGDPGRINTV